MGIEDDAQQIAGKEAVLCCLDADDANDQAIYRCDDPAIPQSLSDENRGEDRQQARNIVEMKHVFTGPFPR